VDGRGDYSISKPYAKPSGWGYPPVNHFFIIKNSKQMSTNLTTVASGNFSKTEANFTGYDLLGNRIHIPMRQLEAAGIKKGDKITFPLYCVAVEREFQRLDPTKKDADGNPLPLLKADGTPDTFKRIQSGSLFLTKEAGIAAINSDEIIADERRIALIESKVKLQAAATAANLSEPLMADLLALA
jgi:hypothetical protein